MNHTRRNILKASGLSLAAIAVTGYAGPGDNAGLAYIGINLFNIYSISKITLKGSRNEIRKQVCTYALNELYCMVKSL